ncbi:MAG TPA: LuxR C-terminal-related transcriptional regulator [Ktedonobacteraceae bacterium]|nr:LuxR C-terminal-related transcriptional regulator [Ktedonobacteraceae bacterium]
MSLTEPMVDAISDFPAGTIQNLPTQLTSLIGRECEIAAVCALLERKEVRLLTLSGTGGIGKTRLGIEVAARLFETFTDGVAFVPLAPIIHPGLVLLTIKQTLGLLQPLRGQSTRHIDDLKTFLRDRHMLLVLDNFEQVLAAVPAITDLLLACPDLKVLVTSRAVLHVQGEYEFIVPPLALPRWTHLPAIEALTQYASVALFLERALAIKPDLSLTKANMQAIATICVNLEGIPLAIELAAARVKLLPPQALLRQLTKTRRFEILTGGTRDAPERQQTLRNTLAWSYNLLDQTEQQLFRLISIFVGGCTLEAIESISETMIGEAEPVLDTLAALIDKSLLHQSEEEGEEVRFVMLETVREYGLDCLHTCGEDEAAWQSLAAYFLALAEQAEPQYAGSEQAAWLQLLEQEHENMRAVLHWLLIQGEAGRGMTMALRLGAALKNFWAIRGPYREGRVFLERALAVREGVAPAIQAKALLTAASLAFLQSDFNVAEAYCQESLQLFRELEDRTGIAYALYLLSWVARDDITIDIALAEEALALFREIGDREYIAWSLYTLGYLDYLRGAYENAFRLIEESIVLQKELGNTRGVAHGLITMARIHIAAHRDLARADAYLAKGVPLLKKLDDQVGFASTGVLRAQLALYRGDAAQARLLLEETLILYKKIGSQEGMIFANYYLARAANALDDDATACAFYRESLAIARKLNMKECIAACLEGLADVSAIRGRYERAACLRGTAEVLREAVHIPIPLIDRASFECSLDCIRAHLGEHTFTTLRSLGRTMTPEQVLALQDEEIALSSSSATTTPLPDYPAGLTEREVQVLRLVARGLTNREIAEELGLSKKTIAHHMTHIFNRTTSENRSAAVAFAFRHGLI